MMGLALAALMMSGCSDPAAPFEPEALPVFASDDEAFAAAEATYRAYVDALNDVVIADTNSFEPVFAMTIGELNADDRKYLSQLHASGVVKSGAAEVTFSEAMAGTAASGSVSLAVCLDVSQVHLADTSGMSFVDAERVDVQTMTVLAQVDQDAPTGFVIADVVGRDGSPTCEP